MNTILADKILSTHTFKNTGKYWSIQVNTGQYRSIQVNTGQYGSIRVNTGQYRSVQVNTGQYGSIRVNPCQYGSIGVNRKSLTEKIANILQYVTIAAFWSKTQLLLSINLILICLTKF